MEVVDFGEYRPEIRLRFHFFQHAYYDVERTQGVGSLLLMIGGVEMEVGKEHLRALQGGAGHDLRGK